MKKGFTLLEVLVSMAIISSTIIIIYQIFSLTWGNFSKIRERQNLYIALTNIVEEINLFDDLAIKKEGNGKIGKYEYNWVAIAEIQERPMTWIEDMPGPYNIGLYKINVKVFLDEKKKNYEFTFYKLGWQRGER